MVNILNERTLPSCTVRYSSSLNKPRLGTPIKRKNTFFLNRYLEIISGPTPRLKSVLARKVKVSKSPRSITIPHFLKHKRSREILTNLYLEYHSSHSRSLMRLARKADPSFKKRQLTFRKVLVTGIPTQVSSDRALENKDSGKPLLFSKPYVLPYLKSKYEEFEQVLGPDNLDSYHLTLSYAPIKYSTFNRLTSLLGISWFIKWQNFSKLYTSLNSVPHGELYLRARKGSQFEVKHYLQFKFKGSKVLINLLDIAHQLTHISLSPGIFVKYFQNKKSLRKNKSMKLLMIRFLRKLLLILKLRNVIILSRGVPVQLDLLLSTLFRPLSHPFIDPLSSEVVDETQATKGNLNVSSLLFLTPKPFGFQKTRKKGRVKRKIRRKIVRLSSVID